MRDLSHTDDVFLVDASSFMYRSYFASLNGDPVYNVAPDGTPIGGVRLFMDRLYGFRKFGASGRRPTHMGIIYDQSRRSFRHDLYPGYKANRPETPDEFKAQLPIMREVATVLGITGVEQEGYEADDLIATYAFTAAEMGASVLIISADKDLLQLVRPNIAFFDPPSGLPDKPGYRPERVFESDADVISKMGVPPALVPHMQALAGDTGDDIPGVPKVGPKVAASLVNQFGELENVLLGYQDVLKLKNGEPNAAAKAIAAHEDQARLSLKLASLCTTVPYETCVEEMILGDVDYQQGIDFCTRYNLASMSNRLQEDWTWAPMP